MHLGKHTEIALCFQEECQNNKQISLTSNIDLWQPSDMQMFGIQTFI